MTSRGPWKISETVRALCPSLGLLSLFLASCYIDLHLHSSLQLTHILTWFISLHAHRHPEKVSNTCQSHFTMEETGLIQLIL